MAQIFVHGDSLQVSNYYEIEMGHWTTVLFLVWWIFETLIFLVSVLYFSGMPGGDCGTWSRLSTYLDQEKRDWRIVLWTVQKQGEIFFFFFLTISSPDIHLHANIFLAVLRMWRQPSWRTSWGWARKQDSSLLSRWLLPCLICFSHIAGFDLAT